ncbi:MAG: hypothetical protein MUF57_06410 [Gammaproteobacteria bacterium]|nr:hypothetical protein [Gammaproteobacteria bacterium]
MTLPEVLAVKAYRFPAAIVVLGLALGAAGPLFGHDADAGSPRLGAVHFPVSCNAAAQKEFEVAMAYYHSFAWPELKARAWPTGAAPWRISTTRSFGRARCRRKC